VICASAGSTAMISIVRVEHLASFFRDMTMSVELDWKNLAEFLIFGRSKCINSSSAARTEPTTPRLQQILWFWHLRKLLVTARTNYWIDVNPHLFLAIAPYITSTIPIASRPNNINATVVTVSLH